MARSPIVNATLQAALLGAVSNVLAQLITAYRNDAAIEVNWVPVFQYVIFSIINTPPNFLWQDFLESTFPARLSPPPPAKKGDKPSEEGDKAEQPLNLRNTVIKFALDQTIGATFNTLLFSTYVHSIQMAMQGAPRITNFTKATGYWISPGVIEFQHVDMQVVWEKALAEFWTIVLAGMKLWPAVSIVNYTMVKTVEGRTLVGCLAGLGWGVYMSMVAARN